MKILSVTDLPLDGVKVVRFGRFADARGYFSVPFFRPGVDGHPALDVLAGTRFVQVNESYSRPGVVRGLHFQWRPPLGKLVRTIHGHMVDIVVDIRRGSPTRGKAIMHDMPAPSDAPWAEWIWVPPGFAHGNFFPEETRIEYFCTGEYNPACEAGLSPMAPDLDWSLCEPALKSRFDALVASGGAVLSDKDRAGLTLSAWLADERSMHFE
jgi:dTDP-4-dehydrorhamnose 3,5-epimerase